MSHLYLKHLTFVTVGNLKQDLFVWKPMNKELTRPTYRRTVANLYPLERQLTKACEPSFDLEGGAKGQI